MLSLRTHDGIPMPHSSRARVCRALIALTSLPLALTGALAVTADAAMEPAAYETRLTATLVEHGDLATTSPSPYAAPGAGGGWRVAAGTLYHQDLGAVRAECDVSGWVGENVLYNYNGGAAYAVQQWMTSEGHRANILEPEYGVIGVAQHHDAAAGRYYAAQVFGSAAP